MSKIETLIEQYHRGFEEIDDEGNRQVRDLANVQTAAIRENALLCLVHRAPVLRDLTNDSYLRRLLTGLINNNELQEIVELLIDNRSLTGTVLDVLKERIKEMTQQPLTNGTAT